MESLQELRHLLSVQAAAVENIGDFLLKRIFVPIAIHADPQHEEVFEQELDKMHYAIIPELFAEILAAEICLGDLRSIEWLLHGLLDAVELIVIALMSKDLSLDNISNSPQAVSHDGQLLRKGEIEASSLTPEKTA